MAVFVDRLVTTKGLGSKWGFVSACHMIADTPEELHDMAAALGLRRSWAQDEGKPSLHYDLTTSKRRLAISQGAIEIDWRSFAAKIMNKRTTYDHA